MADLKQNPQRDCQFHGAAAFDARETADLLRSLTRRDLLDLADALDRETLEMLSTAFGLETESYEGEVDALEAELEQAEGDVEELEAKVEELEDRIAELETAPEDTILLAWHLAECADPLKAANPHDELIRFSQFITRASIVAPDRAPASEKGGRTRG